MLIISIKFLPKLSCSSSFGAYVFAGWSHEVTYGFPLYQVCSDINKPNGQFVLPNDRTAIMTFISSLPIRKVYFPVLFGFHIFKFQYKSIWCSIYLTLNHSSTRLEGLVKLLKVF